MARTKTKPGPKPKYGEREEIHVLVPVDDLAYIRSVTDNITGWIIEAIREKRELDSALAVEVTPLPTAAPDRIRMREEIPQTDEGYIRVGSRVVRIADILQWVMREPDRDELAERGQAEIIAAYEARYLQGENKADR